MTAVQTFNVGDKVTTMFGKTIYKVEKIVNRKVHLIREDGKYKVSTFATKLIKLQPNVAVQSNQPVTTTVVNHALQSVVSAVSQPVERVKRKYTRKTVVNGINVLNATKKSIIAVKNGSKYLIEKGIPIPESVTNKAGTSKYPFVYMEDGDSFLVPYVDNNNKKKTRSMINGSVILARKKESEKGFTFTVRALDDGIRVWKVKK
jgi:hypothetical protein